jgi:integrase
VAGPDVDTAAILKIVEPIWIEKHPTARRSGLASRRSWAGARCAVIAAAIIPQDGPDSNRHKEPLDHRVPLTGRMIKLLKALPREGGDDGLADGLVFIGSKANTPLGKMIMPKLVDAMKYDVTIHGFRASFKTWATEQTSYPREIIEFCLAHVVGPDSEQAYLRSDVLEKRRHLMEAWSTFVSTPRKIGVKQATPIRKEAGV